MAAGDSIYFSMRGGYRQKEPHSAIEEKQRHGISLSIAPNL